MKRTAALLAAILLAFSACQGGDGEESLPEEQPGIRGVITLAEDSAGSGRVLIEANPDEPSGSPKASVRWDEDTRLLKRTAEGVRRATPEDFAVDRRASAWFTGPVAESYPVQAKASVLLAEE